MAVAEREEGRRLPRAELGGIGATRMERAAGGHRQQVWRRAGDRGQRRELLAGDRRHRVEQADRVGVLRVVEDVAHVADLDQLAGVHRRDAVGQLGGEREVVRDEEHGEAQPLPQRANHVDDGPLGQDVERGRRLVEDDQLRFQQEAERDRDALPHAAAQLVRIGGKDALARRAGPCATARARARSSAGRPSCRGRGPSRRNGPPP